MWRCHLHISSPLFINFESPVSSPNISFYHIFVTTCETLQLISRWDAVIVPQITIQFSNSELIMLGNTILSARTSYVCLKFWMNYMKMNYMRAWVLLQGVSAYKPSKFHIDNSSYWPFHLSCLFYWLKMSTYCWFVNNFLY